MWVIESNLQPYTGRLTGRPSISTVIKENTELPLLDCYKAPPLKIELKYACDFYYIDSTFAF